MEGARKKTEWREGGRKPCGASGLEEVSLCIIITVTSQVNDLTLGRLCGEWNKQISYSRWSAHPITRCFNVCVQQCKDEDTGYPTHLT